MRYIEWDTHGVEYTLRKIHKDWDIYRMGYTQGGINMEYRVGYTRGGIYMDGILTKWDTHGVKYTQVEIQRRWNTHGVGYIRGGIHTGWNT